MQQYEMLKPLVELLQTALETELLHLQAITEQVAEEKAGSKWSRKEELGHLIDSASNNHLRFVRAALEREFRGSPYDQNGSVTLHGYQDLRWADLLEFWRRYNYLIVEVVARIPEEKLETPCTVGSSAPVTLHFLITDYVRHMQHHVDHILGRAIVTSRP